MAALPLSPEQREGIRTLCEQFGVRSLRLFGSAAKGSFDAARSDLDFLVELGPVAGLNRFQQFMRLKLALEDLLERPVDLVSASAVHDARFRAAAESAAIELYAA